MEKINWLQAVIFYIAGGLTFAMVKAWLAGLKSKVA